MNNFCELTNSELLNVDGGFSWGVVWTGVKVAGAVLGVGAAGCCYIFLLVQLYWVQWVQYVIFFLNKNYTRLEKANMLY